MALVLGSGALAVSAGVTFEPGIRGFDRLDWQRGSMSAQPWRFWSAAWVHWSDAHLAANLAGVSVIGWLGWRAGMGATAALAWGLAWPLTHLLLTWLPAHGLRHYGGLSGVLHAGVIVIGLSLAWPTSARSNAPQTPAARRRRWVGYALALGTIAKVLHEAPWELGLQPHASLGIQVVPLAHAWGIAAGALAWALVSGLQPLLSPRDLRDTESGSVH